MLSAFVLVGLDVLLRAPGTRVASFFVTPTTWLAKWMDPHTALISAPVPSSGSTSSAGGPTRVSTIKLPGGGQISGITTVGPIPFIPNPFG